MWGHGGGGGRRHGWGWESWGRGSRRNGREGRGPGPGPWWGRVRPQSSRLAAGLGQEEGGHDGLGTFRGPAPARPPTWARWTLCSQSHQPDSPRGRLRRQTAMHRAPPPAPAPQPACAIARPPARSLPRAVSRFQGHRTVLSGRRASTGPGTRMQNTGHVHPEPPSPRPPS